MQQNIGGRPKEVCATEEEKNFQFMVLIKYRESGVIPSTRHIMEVTEVCFNTVNSFLNGNSANAKVMEYIHHRLTTELDPLPEEIDELFNIWAKYQKKPIT